MHGVDPPVAPAPAAAVPWVPPGGGSAADAAPAASLADRGDSLKPPALTGGTLVREMDAPLASPSVILVPRVAGLSEGSALVKGAHLGRLLGAGRHNCPMYRHPHAAQVLRACT